VDVSGDAVEYCRRLGLNCRTTDSVRLPFEDGTFDVVTGWHVIEHVRDAVETLAEWRRVLRPGGVLVLETPDSDCVKVRLRGANYRRFWTVEHTYTFNRRNFLPFVERAGLEVLSAPVLGHVGPLKTTMRAYAVGYALAKGLQRITGLSKAFQVFARRPRITVDPPHSPRPVGRMVRSSSPAAGQCEPPPSGEGYRAFRRGLLSTGDRLSDGF